MEYLLDSSVIIKWFLGECDSDKAINLQDNYLDGKVNLVVADLVFYEVANALRYSPYKIPKGGIKWDIDSLFRLRLETIPFNWNFFEMAIDLMFDFEITVYDAYFLAIAKELGLVFITADEKLYLKTRNLDYTRLLRDFK